MDKDTRLYASLLVVSTILPLISLLLNKCQLTSGFSIWIGVIMVLIFVPLILMGVYMAVTGKGQSLISGYNMMSKDQRSLFKGQELAKAVGWVVLIICVPILIGMIAMFFFTDYITMFISIVLGLILVVLMLIYMNTGGRYLKDPNVKPRSSLSKRSKIGICVVVAIITIVSICGIYMLTQYGSVNASLNDESLHVDAPMLDENIAYTDIDYVELTEDLDLGYRASGFAGAHVLSGLFHNDLYGDYHLGVYKSVDIYIVVHHGGNVLVFNCDSAEDTAVFYAELYYKISE